MFDDEAAPQQQPAVQIMQSVTINPIAEFCPDPDASDVPVVQFRVPRFRRCRLILALFVATSF